MTRKKIYAAVAVLVTVSITTCSACRPNLELERESSPYTGPFDHAHATWGAVLAEVVHGDRVDYGALAAAPGELHRYLDELESITAEVYAAWSEPQQLAFWINAYNAYTLALVANEYPVSSIRSIGGPLSSVFDLRFIPLGSILPESGFGERISLGELEHEILRTEFDEARIHVAINCASVSCPPLLERPFVAPSLDEQLEAAARAFVTDTSRNRLDEQRVSSIFLWFKHDFVQAEGSLSRWINRYAGREALQGDADIRFLDYEWSLNDFRDESTPAD